MKIAIVILSIFVLQHCRNRKINEFVYYSDDLELFTYRARYQDESERWIRWRKNGEIERQSVKYENKEFDFTYKGEPFVANYIIDFDGKFINQQEEYPEHSPKSLPDVFIWDFIVERWVKGEVDDNVKRHGRWKMWYPDEIPSGYITYSHGKRDGPLYMTDRQGKFLYKIEFEDDYPVEFCPTEDKCLEMLKPNELKMEDFHIKERWREQQNKLKGN